MTGLLLGVDLGGTKGLLGLFEPGASRPVLQLRYACAEFDGFEPMLARFLADAAARLGPLAARPAVACIGLAGPVAGRRARMTNLPWTLDAGALRKRFALGPVRLVN
ncbi:MAG: glucokinase, partial [Gammaproteobacteria bacterium]